MCSGDAGGSDVDRDGDDGRGERGDYVAPPVTVSGQNFCEALAEAIQFLEGLPESRLRNFLLAQFQRGFAAHCQG